MCICSSTTLHHIALNHSSTVLSWSGGHRRFGSSRRRGTTRQGHAGPGREQSVTPHRSLPIVCPDTQPNDSATYVAVADPLRISVLERNLIRSVLEINEMFLMPLHQTGCSPLVHICVSIGGKCEPSLCFFSKRFDSEHLFQSSFRRFRSYLCLKLIKVTKAFK